MSPLPFLAAVLAAPPAPPLQAGVARIDITPPLSMKASLGGYGDRMSKPATGIHDRVMAKALVLRQGKRRFAIVTADILGFPPGFREAVADKLRTGGWRPNDLLLLPSHSHTSIDMSAINPRNDLGVPQLGIYQRPLFERTRDRLAAVVRSAARAPVAVRVGYDQTYLPGWNRNRREGNTITDDALTVVRVDTVRGRPLAALISWTAHPTFMDSDDMEFSGDWPGHVQRAMEARIGRDAVVMYCNGAEGDQSATPRGGETRWERAERYGIELADEVMRVWAGIRTSGGVTFAAHTQPVKLPGRVWHPDFMKTGGAEYGMTPATAAILLERLAPPTTHTTALRVGDVVVVGVPGELTAEMGLRLKRDVAAATGAKSVIIGGLADEWVSYMLSPEEYRKGGYEASVSLYGPDLAPTVIGAATEGARRVRR